MWEGPVEGRFRKDGVYYFMPRYTLQSSAFHNNTRPIIWLDVEKRINDLEPALTSVYWADGLKTYAHDPILEDSARAQRLEFQPWAQLAAEIVRVAMASNSLIAGYSIPERDLLMASCPDHTEWIDENYLNANAAKWFRNQRPEVYAEALRKAKGEGRKPGLKDFLIQPAVGYAYEMYLLDVEPGTFLGRMRELLDKQNGVYRDLTKEAHRDWINFIEYNRHDVLGMIHVAGYVKGAGRQVDQRARAAR